MKSSEVIKSTLASNVLNINLKHLPISFFGILLMAQISKCFKYKHSNKYSDDVAYGTGNYQPVP